MNSRPAWKNVEGFGVHRPGAGSCRPSPTIASGDTSPMMSRFGRRVVSLLLKETEAQEQLRNLQDPEPSENVRLWFKSIKDFKAVTKRNIKPARGLY